MTTMLNAMHPDEWQARQELAACYRIFHMLGWAEMIYNHITVRLPESVSGDDKQFLINPFGLHYSEVTASNLLKINISGQKLDLDNPWPVNPAGFTVHAAIHAALPNAHCVMHTHTTSGIAVACSQEGVSQHNFYGAQLKDRIGYHDFEGITIHAEEGPRLLKNIADKQAIVLRNHGLLSWGRTLPEAFALLWTLQRACDVQLAAAALGKPILISDEVASKCARDSFQFNPNMGAGQDVFNAMTRLVDKIDSSYKA